MVTKSGFPWLRKRLPRAESKEKLCCMRMMGYNDEKERQGRGNKT